MNLKKYIYVFLMTFIFQNAFAMKIQYQYDDCEEEHHTGAIITLNKNDINPEIPSMKSNYNKLGAAILRGASENNQRYFEIREINDRNVEFARALMRKTYEIAMAREVPLTLSFYGTGETKNVTLSNEWEPLQQKIDEFYVNPFTEWCLYGSGSD